MGVLCAEGACVWGFCRGECLCFLPRVEDFEFMERSEREMDGNQNVIVLILGRDFLRE